MRRLVYLQPAIRDLGNILDYLARQNTGAITSQAFVNSLRAQCRRLAKLPGILGRARPELGFGFRSFTYRGYVIFFRYHANEFQVINVIEGHRDFDAYFNPSSPNETAE